MNDIVIETLDEVNVPVVEAVDLAPEAVQYAIETTVDGKVYEVRDGDEVVGYVQKAPEAEEVI